VRQRIASAATTGVLDAMASSVTRLCSSARPGMQNTAALA
jgi:hypothetical protein